MGDPRGNFGIAAARCFTGSMFGQPPLVFAVWFYAIANAKPSEDDDYGLVGMVELNPAILSATFGGADPKDIESAIDYLEGLDPDSTTKDHDGRRMVRVGQFERLVLNLGKYRKLFSMDALRTRWREEKQRQRQSKTCPGQSRTTADSPTVPSSSSSSSLSPSNGTTETSTPERRHPSRQAERPDDVEPDLWQEFLAYRRSKRAPVTDRVMRATRASCEKAGMTLTEGIEWWIANGQTGFFPPGASRSGSGRAGSRMPHNFTGKDYGESGPI